MRSRSESLEFALLGLLSQGPLHGYELRKRMTAIYGPFRALSFSVLYPQLRRMMEAQLIEESFTDSGGLSRRSRIVYDLTQKGKNKISELMESASPDTFEDEGFEVRFAFFGPALGPRGCTKSRSTVLASLGQAIPSLAANRQRAADLRAQSTSGLRPVH